MEKFPPAEGQKDFRELMEWLAEVKINGMAHEHLSTYAIGKVQC